MQAAFFPFLLPFLFYVRGIIRLHRLRKGAQIVPSRRLSNQVLDEVQFAPVLMTVRRVNVEHISPSAVFSLFQERVIGGNNVRTKNQHPQGDGNKEQRAGHDQDLVSLGKGVEYVHVLF